MESLLSFLALLFGPPVLGIVAGLLQWLAYRIAVAVGITTTEKIPPFIILWLRGLIVVVAIAAGLGIWSASGRAPMAP